MDFVILALATWRIASLLAHEDGPGEVFVRLRVALGVRYDLHSQPYGETPVSQGILCLWCNSVWVGVCIVFLYWLWIDITWFLLPLALSTGAILVERAVKRG